MINLQGCTTVEQCLDRLGEWLTQRERTEKEIEKVMAAIFMLTGEKPQLVRSALGILLDANGRVLLLRRRKDARSFPDSYSFPGGQMDKTDSSLEETVLRETEQETGLRAKILSYHSTRYTTVPYRGRIYQVAFYTLSSAGQTSVHLSAEHTDSIWEFPNAIVAEAEKYPLSGTIIHELLKELAVQGAGS
jgi:8-oxo-dGTP pyrophosphatase MutT (NUDIX family)